MKKQEQERKQERINIDYLTEEDLSNDSEIDKAASKEKESLFGLPKGHIKLAVKISFWFIFTCGMVLIAVKMYHLVMPIKYYFLGDAQIKNIDAILFSSVLSALMTKLSSKVFNSE